MEAEMASPTLSQVTPAQKVRVISLPKPATKTQPIESKLHLAPQPAVSLAPVIPFPQTISQLEIGLLVSLRNRVAQLEAQVKESEDSIKARLEAGATVEAGDRRAELKENFRRNVAWK